MTYLDSIVAWHRRRAASDDRDLHTLKQTALERLDGRPRRPFLAALQEGSRLSVIAEIKRRSPSKGDIRVELDPSGLARQYAVGGATCLSVLTDEPHFGALAGDLAAARDAIRALADGYIASLPAKLDAIDEAWVALTARQWSGESGRELHRAVHSIAGSARVFGVPAVGEAARAVEHALQPLLGQDARPDEQALQAVANAIRQLRTSAVPVTP